MKKIHIYLLSAVFIVFSFACNKQQPGQYTSNIDSTIAKLNYPSVAEFIAQHGDLITQQDFPPVISQYELLSDPNALVIDIRRPADYIAGHIDGAYNVPRDSVLQFLTKVKNPAAYDKVVIVCYTGQTASYTATMLRFYGIGNAYSLKYGMGGWNKKFKGIFDKNMTGKYENKLDTTTYKQPAEGQLPQLPAGNPIDVIQSRVKELIKIPAKDFLISADEVFANPEDYFVISYLPPAKYKAGHIPGAVRYNTRSDLSFYQKLKTLPTDKKIVVYCNIGQHSAAIVAYLKLLGYDAYSLKFGLNSFMHNKAIKNAWFSDKGFLNLPVLEGAERTSNKPAANTPEETPATQQANIPVVPAGGQSEPEGGGCE